MHGWPFQNQTLGVTQNRLRMMRNQVKSYLYAATELIVCNRCEQELGYTPQTLYKATLALERH